MKVRKIREVSWRGEDFEKGRIGKSTDTSSVVDSDPNWIRIQQLCESGFVFQVQTPVPLYPLEFLKRFLL